MFRKSNEQPVKYTTNIVRSKSFAFDFKYQIVHVPVGWEYEMQTAGVKKPFQPKCVQVEFVANIQPMLECFVSLYELEKSSLQDVFLCPSSQYEDVNSSINTNFAEKDSVCLSFNLFNGDSNPREVLKIKLSSFREFWIKSTRDVPFQFLAIRKYCW